MKNKDSVVDPIHYLEMLFGRFINDSQEFEHRRLNYFVFAEIVTGFTACGVFKDLEEYEIASKMVQRLQIVLDLNFE